MTGPKIDLSGQVAIVTGGGGGIGQGCSLAMARYGADVVVADIEPSRCEATVAMIEKIGRKVLGVPTDVMDTDQVRAMVADADKKFGRVDILVNNAGGVSSRNFLDQSERSWRRHIDINLVSMLAATHAVAPIMIREGRGGSIVNVSSLEGSRAAPTFAIYAACKAGMQNFTRTFALEVSQHDIRVNCIAPDHTVTPGNSGNRTGPVDEGRLDQEDSRGTGRHEPADSAGLRRPHRRVRRRGGLPMLSHGPLHHRRNLARRWRHLGFQRLGAWTQRKLDAAARLGL